MTHSSSSWLLAPHHFTKLIIIIIVHIMVIIKSTLAEIIINKSWNLSLQEYNIDGLHSCFHSMICCSCLIWVHKSLIVFCIFSTFERFTISINLFHFTCRLVLRCRQEARARFAKLRSDVLVKLELLDSKHVQHLTEQLTRLIAGLANYHTQCQELMHDKHWFPIELDMVGTTLHTDHRNDDIQVIL